MYLLTSNRVLYLVHGLDSRLSIFDCRVASARSRPWHRVTHRVACKTGQKLEPGDDTLTIGTDQYGVIGFASMSFDKSIRLPVHFELGKGVGPEL